MYKENHTPPEETGFSQIRKTPRSSAQTPSLGLKREKKLSIKRQQAVDGPARGLWFCSAFQETYLGISQSPQDKSVLL